MKLGRMLHFAGRLGKGAALAVMAWENLTQRRRGAKGAKEWRMGRGMIVCFLGLMALAGVMTAFAVWIPAFAGMTGV